MLVCTDQLKKEIELHEFPPKRIVSLVPSQTELLYDLGLEKEVVGITKFCVHPEHWFRSKERIGGTKSINIEKVKLINPDLVIANKEENVKEQIDELEKFAPVWTSDVQTFEDALHMIKSIGQITNTSKKAESLITQVTSNFNKLKTENSELKTCYLIWRNPYMTIGGDTFINNMLNKCGFQNVFGYLKRYPEISIEQLQSVNPQIILLSSEPYPFKENHIEELSSYFPGAKIMLVNGEMFSWYGSRMLYASAYFNDLLGVI